MAGLALARKRWTPSPTAQVDSSHPLASGLLGCWIGAGEGVWVNIVSGQGDLRAFTAQATSPVTPYGPSLGGGNLQQSASGQGQVTLDNRSLSMMVAGSVGPLAAELGNEFNITDLFGYSTGSVGPFFRFGDSGRAEGKLQFVVDNEKASDSVSLVKGDTLLAVGVSDASNVKLYHRGVRTVGGIAPAGSRTFLPGANAAYTSTARWSAHSISIACIWNYPLPDAAIQALLDDPFCMLKG